MEKNNNMEKNKDPSYIVKKEVPVILNIGFICSGKQFKDTK